METRKGRSERPYYPPRTSELWAMLPQAGPECRLSARARNVLWCGGYETIAQIAAAHDDELQLLRNMGPRTLRLIRSVVPYRAGAAAGEGDALRKVLAEALDFVERQEWNGATDDFTCCPECLADPQRDQRQHRPGCGWVALRQGLVSLLARVG